MMLLEFDQSMSVLFWAASLLGLHPADVYTGKVQYGNQCLPFIACMPRCGCVHVLVPDSF